MAIYEQCECESGRIDRESDGSHKNPRGVAGVVRRQVRALTSDVCGRNSARVTAMTVNNGA